MSVIIVLLIVILTVLFLFKIIEYVVEKDNCFIFNYKNKEELKSITIKCPNCGDIYTLKSEKEMANGGNDLVSCYKCGYRYRQIDNILSTKE